jgi:hypothetical protein
MTDPRASVFWQSAAKSGLLDARALQACYDAIPPEKRTADAIDRRLARQAVNAGLLTLWQAQQVLSGRHAGLRIDRYVLRDLIGQGGMGRVYLAQDTKLKRPVALKILSRERMTNPRALARFRREARVGAQLQHENLIRVYDEGEFQGVNYLVMEYITGKTVAQLIAEHGRLPPELAADLGRQVALGLDHLHQKGLLHRDVNPMNVLVDRDGTAKLTDLGLAIDPNDEEDEVVTRDGATVGTFDYISPEQARHSRRVDSRSDIYSLGCTLYHMLAGHVPFPAPSLPEKLFAHQSAEPEPLPSEVPGGLADAVRTMMSKEPEGRFARPRDAARALEPFAAPRAGAAGAGSGIALGPRSEASTVTDRMGAVGVPPAARRSNSDGELAAAAPGPAVALAVGPSTSGLSPSPEPAPASPAPEGPAPAPAGTSDPFQIDLGPPPGLSQGLSASRSRDDHRARAVPWRTLGPVAAALAVLGVLAYLAGWVGGGRGGGDGAAAGGDGRAGAAAPRPESDVYVRYKDGAIYEAKDLREAVQLAAGKPAWVELQNAEPMTIEVDAPIRVPFGELRIRAREGTAPALAIEFRRPVSFLRLGPGASLRLEGLTVEVGAASVEPGRSPTLIESYGPVELSRLAVGASEGARAARVLDAQAKSTRMAGCWVEGFDEPVRLSLPEGSSARFEQCMFIRPGGDAGGWPVFARPYAGGGKGRSLRFERCTAVGAGLLHAEGFDERTPIEVEVLSCVVSGRALLLWGGAFPGGLHYRGQANLYEVSGAAWVLATPDGLSGVPGGPADLQTWAARAPTKDEDSRVLDVQFRREPSLGTEARPADFTLLNIDPPKPGADPSQVGPRGGLPRGEAGGEPAGDTPG